MTDASTHLINAAFARLQITPAHLRNCQLPRQAQAAVLVNAGRDVLGRPQQMTPATLGAWTRMRSHAANDGVTLQLVSAFRSIDYQCELVRAKVAAGRTLEEVLQVNAPPGYSEHHTGRALDLTTPESELLTEAFELTPAFTWLQLTAGDFGFHLTYPRDNALGITYEPWHWTWGH